MKTIGEPKDDHRNTIGTLRKTIGIPKTIGISSEYLENNTNEIGIQKEYLRKPKENHRNTWENQRENIGTREGYHRNTIGMYRDIIGTAYKSVGIPRNTI